jgi:hypothetical protein
MPKLWLETNRNENQTFAPALTIVSNEWQSKLWPKPKNIIK